MYVLRGSFAMDICGEGGSTTKLMSVKSMTEARGTGPVWDTSGCCRWWGMRQCRSSVVCYGTCTLCHGDLLS